MTEQPHYEVVATYRRPHPLDVPTLREPIEAARHHGPGAHLRLSPATLHAVREIAAEDPPRYVGGALAPILGPPVVSDPDVPDDEWRIAVWRIDL